MMKIIKQLSAKTANNKITWETTPRRYEFQTAFANYAIIVGEGEHAYYVAIRNEEGVTLETAASNEAVPPESDIPIALPQPEVFRDLYEMARRRALNVDKALDELGNILTSLD